jgi:hypothetical protein
MFFILILGASYNFLGKQQNRLVLITYLFPIFIVIDNLIDAQKVVTYTKISSQNEIEETKQIIQKQYKTKFAAIAFMPFDMAENPVVKNLNIMLASQELGVPCVNAYTGNTPPEFNAFFMNANEVSLDIWGSYNHFDINKIQKIYGYTGFPSKRLIYLKSATGKYLCADESMNNLLVVNRDKVGAWELFELKLLNPNQCCLITNNKKYFSSELYEGGKISAVRTELGEWEKFTLIKQGSSQIALKDINGKFVCLQESTKQLIANSDSITKNCLFEVPEY